MSNCCLCDAHTELGCIRCGATVCERHQARTGVCTACAGPRPIRATLLGVAAALAIVLPLVAAFAYAYARVGPGTPGNWKHHYNGWSYVCGVIATVLIVAPIWTWAHVSRTTARRMLFRAR